MERTYLSCLIAGLLGGLAAAMGPLPSLGPVGQEDPKLEEDTPSIPIEDDSPL